MREFFGDLASVGASQSIAGPLALTLLAIGGVLVALGLLGGLGSVFVGSRYRSRPSRLATGLLVLLGRVLS